MIDRIGPTRRPHGKARGYQQWRSLLFAHWAVPVEVLRPLVPAALELDLFEGVAYAGVVPFAMQGVRPRWFPKRLALAFLETNVRTYVHCDGRPGVYFLSLDAASSAAVWAARRFWGLPYFRANMRLECEESEVRYESLRCGTGVRHEVRYRIGDPLPTSRPGSLEFFLLERYLMFIERRGEIYSGQVYHTPYPAQLAEILELHDALLRASGLGICAGLPCLAHYAAGVDVEIFDLCKCG